MGIGVAVGGSAGNGDVDVVVVVAFAAVAVVAVVGRRPRFQTALANPHTNHCEELERNPPMVEPRALIAMILDPVHFRTRHVTLLCHHHHQH